MNNEVNSRRLFGEFDADEIWVQGESLFPDSKILLTVSNAHGDRTVLITPSEVVPSKPSMFVQAPPERIISKNERRNLRINNLFKVFGYTLSAVLITFSVLSASGFV
jgi:hypothetical protein